MCPVEPTESRYERQATFSNVSVSMVAACHVTAPYEKGRTAAEPSLLQQVGILAGRPDLNDDATNAERLAPNAGLFREQQL